MTLMANHINSTARASLNGPLPFELAQLLLDKKLIHAAEPKLIPADEIMLKKSLLYISSFINFVQNNNLKVKDLLINKAQIFGCNNIALMITLKSTLKVEHTILIQLLSQADGIQYIEAL